MIDMTSRGLRSGLIGAMLFAAGCAAAPERFEARPSLAPGSGAGYREFAADQQREIGDSDLGERPGLASILEMVLARSPDVLRARSEWEAAVERVPQATALPDPAFTVMHFVKSVETRVGPQENVLTLTQRIPFPTKLVAAGDVAEEGARIAALAYSAAVRDALVAAKTSWYEYAYLLRARELVEMNVGVATRLADLGSDLYADDQAFLIDVLKAQSQLAQLHYDLVTLDELISAERTRLNSLMDRPAEAPIGRPGPLDFPRFDVPIETLYETASKNREELLMADRKIERARARIALAESQSAPDLSIGATWIQVGRNEPPLMVPADNGQDAWGLMVGVTIPLWVERNSAGVQEARAEADAAVSGKAATWNQTLSALKDAWVKLTNSARLVVLYRDDLVPQAERVMLQTEERAREDRMRLGDALEVRTVWLNFILAKERAATDYHQALARIERLTGASLSAAADGGGR